MSLKLITLLLVLSLTSLSCYSTVVISGNSTILSDNSTFKLGFFTTTNNNQPRSYLAIWYAAIPTPTYVWVANRNLPIKNLTSATLEITPDGKLAVKDSGNGIVWQTSNTQNAVEAKLLDEGNLVLLSPQGVTLWNSFHFPTDTWLPGMNLSSTQLLTGWKSSTDPEPGKYSLRLKPPGYGEIELVYNETVSYWTAGNWTGNAFTGVPEMTIPYIYRFHFVNPFTPNASFGYTETSLEGGLQPPLTRFHVDYLGQLRQYTWSPQTESWNMFWSQPENPCKVYGLCGNLGFCNIRMSTAPCSCFAGFQPVDGGSWAAGDFSGGCRRQDDDVCNAHDVFHEIGVVGFEGAVVVSFPGTRSACESACLGNCSCIGLYHNEGANLCKNLFGSLLNLRNLTSDNTIEDKLFVRVQRGGSGGKGQEKALILAVVVCGLFAILVMVVLILLVLRKRMIRRRKEEEEAVFPVTNLKVFTYKELHAATRGFSEKLGHGGFGAVFRGQLPDCSSVVAVKRLERPGGGEKEFRAEVCTIGNIQHVNLVRLRGFCSENSHRLLVYDYMPNGPLSVYLRRDGQSLSWDVRFRVAIGTARGIAYLHEECRNCIIHCDIKPENILLDEDFSAKVSDFGLAKLIGRDFSRVLATMRGTWGYVAPEWISGVAITTKADVYSYGMTLLELIGGRRNVEGPPSIGGGEGAKGEKWFFPPWAARHIIEGNVEAVIDDRLSGLYNTEEAERLGSVAVWCIQDEEAMRPTMGMVVKMLEGVVEVAVPPPPKLLQALVSGESFRGVGADSANKVSTDGGANSDTDDYVQLSGDSKESKPVSKIEGVKENEEQKAGESSISSSLEPTPELSNATLEMDDAPIIGEAAVSSVEDPELHHAPSTVLANGDGGDYPLVHNLGDAKNICYVESGKLWAIAAPIAFNILCNYGINSFTNIFVGHIGDVELSAVAISLSVIANFSFGFLLGMGSALETLCGQAFGAGQLDMLGVYMQRSWIILTAACFCILPLYIYSTPILKLLGQRDDIAELAGKFALQVIPQMFSLAINFPTQKFLQAQSKVGMLAWIGFVALIIHIGVLYLFIYVFGWGTAGAAAAYDVSAWGVALAQVAYIVGWCKDGWRGLSWLAFKDIWPFLKLSVASAVMLCLEIWYFMTIIVLTGHLEDPVLAVGSLSICMNVNGWEGMLFIGINAAISVRVSNELGSGHPRAAKYSVVVTVVESLLIGIFFMSIIMTTRNHFAIIFTDSKEMQRAVAHLAYLLGITMVLNSVQPVISGVAVGGGWQGMVAYINLFCYYIVGLPLGFLLGYKAHLGVQGIWIGMITGTLLQTLILLLIVWKTNWNEEVPNSLVEQASERLRKWTGVDEGSDVIERDALT
ncbi:hypothetical protein RJ640_023933 [Escallonia rubra]|uniref:Protein DETOXIFICATION n=1 Tax=Escallonia rubra TaxID=112253 RepID=A0AA88UTJ8_9ASTE|nr:hypothetical protein RJ640_023933 [Escallonia rubra]